MYNAHAFIVLCKATTLLSKRRFKKINMFINMPICLSELVLVCNSKFEKANRNEFWVLSLSAKIFSRLKYTFISAGRCFKLVLGK